ncbi:alpha-1,3-mannosyl-glycoprotein 4-beta-N-acetylglucosaminyltransferase-like protein MGAT4D [Echinops telfairi]|uniref:Alpha-1,3-mannosyl-glycoprotein 4-beta-N-acetylglucosaminyltransferase-like protein MGAT4D n=1 Tax=Echinops telfairi TaxID=9371 RepID=A0ABM0ZSR8_ECHTE|nr:alpha-1,3-mannosyl-glycoprotein 4-beta-N-acetylglucosaminyltransferase-like protein MGAT4D [Echinops telfairi]
MKIKQVNLVIAFVAVVLFSFSCFCISKMTQIGNQLINCKNHILEFKGKILHLRNKTEISFALGISTVSRGAYSYLKQTLTSVISRMTVSEEEDSVVVVSIADSNEEYIHSVVNMIKTKFKKQVMSGSIEVISIPTILYPSMLNAKQSTKESQTLKSHLVKQVLDFCFLMLYAKSKAMYYLQLEDDIITKYMYFTKITEFVQNITTNNWFYIEFSILGFIGKMFRSEDLPDFVRFFLMFYKEKPIDLLLDDIFQIKNCRPMEIFKNCLERNKHMRIRYKPSLFQHVGIHSSFPGREQHYRVDIKEVAHAFVKVGKFQVCGSSVRMEASSGVDDPKIYKSDGRILAAEQMDPAAAVQLCDHIAFPVRLARAVSGVEAALLERARMLIHTIFRDMSKQGHTRRHSAHCHEVDSDT